MTFELNERKAWIFDMDGTLTVAVHDFDAIRDALGIAPGLPILEAIAQKPAGEAAEMSAQLDVLELEFARRARPQPGVIDLLEHLVAEGRRLGIVTRNGLDLAFETLSNAGLEPFFPPESVIARTCAPPKPSPAGIELLLTRWEMPAGNAVMVGDYRFDLDAGRAAGAMTVYFDPDKESLWNDRADVTVCHHDELLGRAAGTDGSVRITCAGLADPDGLTRIGEPDIRARDI